jgi:hypothetical protein
LETCNCPELNSRPWEIFWIGNIYSESCFLFLSDEVTLGLQRTQPGLEYENKVRE